jgi:lipid A ethanolaminephosphotransferase
MHLPRRPVLHAETLVLLCALYLLLACNGPFWRAALAGRPAWSAATWGFGVAMLAAFTAVYVLAAGLLATRHTVRPLLAALVLVAAAPSR